MHTKIGFTRIIEHHDITAKHFTDARDHLHTDILTPVFHAMHSALRSAECFGELRLRKALTLPSDGDQFADFS